MTEECRAKWRAFADARAELREIGISVIPDYEGCGQFRVNFVGGREATAYYADDMDDAIGTGRDMARRGIR